MAEIRRVFVADFTYCDGDRQRLTVIVISRWLDAGSRDNLLTCCIYKTEDVTADHITRATANREPLKQTEIDVLPSRHVSSATTVDRCVKAICVTASFCRPYCRFYRSIVFCRLRLIVHASAYVLNIFFVLIKYYITFTFIKWQMLAIYYSPVFAYYQR